MSIEETHSQDRYSINRDLATGRFYQKNAGLAVLFYHFWRRNSFSKTRCPTVPYRFSPTGPDKRRPCRPGVHPSGPVSRWGWGRK